MSGEEDSRSIINATLRQLCETTSARKKKKILTTALESMEPSERDNAAAWIAAYRMAHPEKKISWERVAVFTSAIVFMMLLIGVNVAVSNPTASQTRAFNTVLALMAGGFGAFLPGAIAVKIRAPAFVIRASSAAAFFVIVYFWKPA